VAGLQLYRTAAAQLLEEIAPAEREAAAAEEAVTVELPGWRRSSPQVVTVEPPGRREEVTGVAMRAPLLPAAGTRARRAHVVLLRPAARARPTTRGARSGPRPPGRKRQSAGSGGRVARRRNRTRVKGRDGEDDRW
jgi:hypothetical protein